MPAPMKLNCQPSADLALMRALSSFQVRPVEAFSWPSVWKQITTLRFAPRLARASSTALMVLTQASMSGVEPLGWNASRVSAATAATGWFLHRVSMLTESNWRREKVMGAPSFWRVSR